MGRIADGRRARPFGRDADRRGSSGARHEAPILADSRPSDGMRIGADASGARHEARILADSRPSNGMRIGADPSGSARSADPRGCIRIATKRGYSRILGAPDGMRSGVDRPDYRTECGPSRIHDLPTACGLAQIIRSTARSGDPCGCIRIATKRGYSRILGAPDGMRSGVDRPDHRTERGPSRIHDLPTECGLAQIIRSTAGSADPRGCIRIATKHGYWRISGVRTECGWAGCRTTAQRASVADSGQIPQTAREDALRPPLTSAIRPDRSATIPHSVPSLTPAFRPGGSATIPHSVPSLTSAFRPGGSATIRIPPPALTSAFRPGRSAPIRIPSPA